MTRRWAAVLTCGVLALVTRTPVAGMAQTEPAPQLTIEPVEVPTALSLRGVAFTDATHGHVVGAGHTILGTTDGGGSWLPRATPVRGAGPGPLTAAPTSSDQSQAQQPFEAVAFPDASHGYAVSQDGHIIATTDGGATWLLQRHPEPADVLPDLPDRPTSWSFFGVSFGDPLHGHVVGDFGVILATSDAGATWTYQGDPRYGNLRAVSFVDAASGDIVGHVTGKPDGYTYAVLNTFDGGTTWTPLSAGKQDERVTTINFDGVEYADPLHGVITGNTGRIFVTFDLGKTWRIRRSGSNEQLNDMAFADNRRGVAVGSVDFQTETRAQVLATPDGGQSWVQFPVPDMVDFQSVTFADPTTAYAVGCARFSGTCQKAGVVKITFPELAPSVEHGSSGGSFPLPLVLLVGAVVVACGAIVFWFRR